ncbi:MAG TPA: Sec-independent protein translocase protein TatB [Wenzhouxiangellaceae bacterium]|nr:Sec-independent protein translocase protein TatB [Wenzhouxiangellaceae bacterium]
MGGAGFTEMLLLAVIALIVVGPHRLPKIARTAGRLTRQARNAWQGLQSELQAELDADHNRKIMEASQARANLPESSEESSGNEATAGTAGENGEQDESADRN